MFYDRVNESLIRQANLLERHESTLVHSDQSGHLSQCAFDAGLEPRAEQHLHLDPNLRSSYMIQTAIGLSASCRSNTTVALTYTNTRALHTEQTVPINTPLPGTYIPASRVRRAPVRLRRRQSLPI
jgi:hypothetical protein